jgi:hypothetical protein
MNPKPRTLICLAAAAALGAVVPAGAQSRSSSTDANTTTTPHPGVASATPEHSESMNRLTEAAQRLRESIQTLATAPAGPQRNDAMDSSRRALLETQQAMIDLPANLRTRSGPMSEADYARAMDKLKEAAQRLRDSAQAMATQPAGQRRNEAIDQVNAALIEVNQAMVQLPWQPGAGTTKTGSTSGKTASGKTASSTSASGSSFDTMDLNHDGMISRSEFSSHN